MNSLMSVPKMQPRLLRLHRPRLEQKDARDDLQAVCNTMLHFLQQRFLLLQQLGDLTFGGTPIGDIFECQENEIAGVSLIEYLPRIQEHRTSSDNGKVSLDFVSLHHGVLWRDVLQQQPKFGDIPLAIAQPIYRTTLNVLTIHPERLIESAICSDNAQVLIENQERIADRIHDRLRERVRFIEVYERLVVRPRQRGSWSGARSIVRRFHICPPKLSSCISKLTNFRPLRRREIHQQRRAWPKVNIRFFKEEENLPLLRVQPHAEVKTVQNCSHSRGLWILSTWPYVGQNVSANPN